MGGNFKVNTWKAFSLNEICEIKPGVRLVSTEMIDEKQPMYKDLEDVSTVRGEE